LPSRRYGPETAISHLGERIAANDDVMAFAAPSRHHNTAVAVLPARHWEAKQGSSLFDRLASNGCLSPARDSLAVVLEDGEYVLPSGTELFNPVCVITSSLVRVV